MNALVLDCDGVILDSVRESFQVARQAYLDLQPESTLGGRDQAPLRLGFLELMPLGNRAEDFGAAMRALDLGLELESQDAYNHFRGALKPEWLAAYHRHFYQVREALAAKAPEQWHRLMRPYAPLVEVLRARAGEVPYALATAKDRRSVEAIFAFHGLSDLFPPGLILDKETGADKAAHLTRLRELLGLRFEELTFVDDKVNHLETVAPLGVRCALAAWGYNGPREHQAARERGYLVCRLDDVERQLFGLPA
jgi:phosphoglycolate phosphatase-like HAD superfamily hydrolase